MIKRIGLLLPRSVIYPSIGFDMIGGLRSNLENLGLSDVEISTESIEIGADDRLIYGACEKLLFSGISIVTGYVNPSSAEKLQLLFASANALFIALDAGYHFPSSTNRLSHVFYLSLQGALCVRTVTKAAAEEGMKNMAYTGSFYDSGYRSVFAFHRGLEDAGGVVTFNHITPLKRADFTLQPLESHLKETAVDAVLASFCGDMLQDFCNASSAGNVFRGHAVYGSSFAGEEQWLAKSPYPGVDIKVCVPWASTLNLVANKYFTEQLRSKNIAANIFSLLGWEAAQLASVALSAKNIDEAISVLEGYTVDSPRGKVELNALTHHCHAPVYEAWVKKNDLTGNCILIPERESPYTDEQRKLLENDINSISGSSTSWFNAYGCLDS